MKWIFPKRVKSIFNILSIVYIFLRCCFYSWAMDMRDKYPTRGYLIDEWSSSIPYIISALVIALCIIANCVKKEKARIVFSIVGLFFVVFGYICTVFETVNYLDIKKTYEQEIKQILDEINVDEVPTVLMFEDGEVKEYTGDSLWKLVR